jgi:hypothetical protein
MTMVPSLTGIAPSFDIHSPQAHCISYATHFIPEVYLNIWQPPKIG